MNIPFPGVDPYIEDQYYWPDFHQRFMTYWCDQLLDSLPDQYEARLEERVRLVDRELGTRLGTREPDVTIERKKQAKGSGTAVAIKPRVVQSPVVLELPEVDRHRESRINILHRPGRILIAVLELLSPDNKHGSGRVAYLEKRAQLLWQDPPIHLVELDMLLRGKRLPMKESLPPGDFFALVSRADSRPKSEVYSWGLREPLPAIPIPLKSPDPDLVSELVEVLHMTYERSRYERSVNYGKPLKLPLSEADRRWAVRQAKARRD